MTQNARLALFVPTTDDADPGEIVEIRGPSGGGKVIPTIFNTQLGASSGIPDAPADNKFYARQNAAWAITVGEAPSNGNLYGRKGAGWMVIPPFPEAPSDGNQYARQNGSWTVVIGLPAVIDAGIMV
jgi:hypothetical protein